MTTDWKPRLERMIADDRVKPSTIRFCQSVLGQREINSEVFPTPNQLSVISRLWHHYLKTLGTEVEREVIAGVRNY
jgi:hypothetical protein